MRLLLEGIDEGVAPVEVEGAPAGDVDTAPVVGIEEGFRALLLIAGGVDYPLPVQLADILNRGHFTSIILPLGLFEEPYFLQRRLLIFERRR